MKHQGLMSQLILSDRCLHELQRRVFRSFVLEEEDAILYLQPSSKLRHRLSSSEKKSPSEHEGLQLETPELDCEYTLSLFGLFRLMRKRNRKVTHVQIDG